jgi:hypothetical protein
MKNKELIEYVSKDMLDDRAEMLSGESDQLFSDDVIARRLAEAENIMCRRAWVLEDTGASCATRIQLVENKTDYSVDKSVLFIKSVRLSDSEVDLSRVGYNDNRVRSALFQPDDQWDVNAPFIENSGRPSRFSTDQGNRIIRIRQKPDAASALLKLHLVVVRMPISAISVANGDKTPEIPEEYHMDLASYAAGKCLSLPTLDATQRAAGRELLNDFNTRVLEAKRDRQRWQQSQPQHRFGGWVSHHEE